MGGLRQQKRAGLDFARCCMPWNDAEQRAVSALTRLDQKVFAALLRRVAREQNASVRCAFRVRYLSRGAGDDRNCLFADVRCARSARPRPHALGLPAKFHQEQRHRSSGDCLRVLPRLQGWLHPDLILGQTCGLPYISKLCDKVELVGTPDYGVEGCPPGFYHSTLVSSSADPRRHLSEFLGSTLAFNGPAIHNQATVRSCRPQHHWRDRGASFVAPFTPVLMRPRCDWWHVVLPTSPPSTPSPGA